VSRYNGPANFVDGARAVTIRFIPHVGSLVGGIVEGILGAAWALVSLFAVPVLALEAPRPTKVLRRSFSVLRGRWPEAITGQLVIAVAFGLLYIPVVIVGIIACTAYVASPGLGIVFAAIAVGLIVLVSSAEAAVSQLFQLAVYAYATDQGPTGPYAEYDFQNPFHGLTLRAPRRWAFWKRDPKWTGWDDEYWERIRSRNASRSHG
jgi:hypothetical protein